MANEYVSEPGLDRGTFQLAGTILGSYKFPADKPLPSKQRDYVLSAVYFLKGKISDKHPVAFGSHALRAIGLVNIRPADVSGHLEKFLAGVREGLDEPSSRVFRQAALFFNTLGELYDQREQRQAAEAARPRRSTIARYLTGSVPANASASAAPTPAVSASPITVPRESAPVSQPLVGAAREAYLRARLTQMRVGPEELAQYSRQK